jgi:hypothetical protein
MLSTDLVSSGREPLPIPAAMDAAARHEVRWLGLDRSLRREISRAVRRGRAVGDPRHAVLAAGYAEATLDWLSRRGRLRPLHLLLAVVAVVELLLTWTWPVTSAFWAALGFAFLRLRMPARRRRLEAARDANTKLAAEWELAPVRVVLPGHAWLYPGTRRRRALVVTLSVLLAAVAALIASSAVLGTIWNRHWAAAANRICIEERGRLTQVGTRRLDARDSLGRRIEIERDALVELDGISHRPWRADRLLEWRRYELELDSWFHLVDEQDPRVPGERVRRTQARSRAQALARRLGASACARV